MTNNPIPAAVRDAIARGATLSISVSGGKDSQAMLSVLAGIEARRKQIVHADLGRAEWPQTPDFVDKLSADSGIGLNVVRRVRGDLVSRIEQRLDSVSSIDGSTPAKPFWPSAMQRYCTSDMKRGPIQKQQRSLGKGELIVSCVGMRAEESKARAKKCPLEIEKAITSKALHGLDPAAAVRRWDGTGRLVLRWLVIHDWSQADVWHEIGHSLADLDRRRAMYRAAEPGSLDGFKAHPAYVFGNERLSCALCVLASVGDLCNGRQHHPELYRRYVELEERSGFTFRDGFSLKDRHWPRLRRISNWPCLRNEARDPTPTLSNPR